MTKNIILPEAAFLDWDGTLVDSYKFLESAHNHVRRSLGFPIFEGDEFREYFGKPRDVLYTAFYGDKRDEARDLFGGYVRANHIKDLKPMHGAEAMLQAFHDRGIVMGLVSNKKREFLEAEIESFGWNRFFASVVGAGDAAEDKPSAAPLLLAVEKSGFGGGMDSVWYVGDTDIDLRCADNALCRSVFINHDNRDEAWLAPYKPFLIFRNCQELSVFLLQSDKKPLKA